jgi:hypothetical protein
MLYKNLMDGEWVAAKDGATGAIPDAIDRRDDRSGYWAHARR